MVGVVVGVWWRCGGGVGGGRGVVEVWWRGEGGERRGRGVVEGWGGRGER